MGLSQLWLVGPERLPCAEATARASGATDILEAARTVESLGEAVAGCALVTGLSARRRELMPPLRGPGEAATELLAATALGDVAFVFGTERTGLSNEEVMLCQRLATIPANPAYASLNLAAAVQIMAYELRLKALAPQAPVDAPLNLAPQQDVERFFGHLEAVLVAKGFLNPQSPRRLMPKLRRLFARTGLEKEEVNILRGILDAVSR